MTEQRRRSFNVSAGRLGWVRIEMTFPHEEADFNLRTGDITGAAWLSPEELQALNEHAQAEAGRRAVEDRADWQMQGNQLQ